MKRNIISLLVLISSQLISMAQGTVIFRNTVPILLPDGTPLPAGSAFQIEFMFAPDGTPADVFDSVAVRLGAPVTIGPQPGLFNSGSRTVAGVTPGGFALFQGRLWETAYGSSFQEACDAGNPNAFLAKTPIVRVDTADPTTMPPEANTVVILNEWNRVVCVPEPSAVSLGAVAMGVGLFIRSCGKKGVRRR